MQTERSTTKTARLDPARWRTFASGDEDALVRVLGWFSLAVGLAELAAPRLVAGWIGVRPRPFVLRFLGAREIASGIGILAQPRPAMALWSRVAGDLMDLGLLTIALGRNGGRNGRVAAAAAGVAAITALDVIGSGRESRRAGLIGEDGGVHARKSILINRSTEEIYRFWRDLQNLPRFMFHLESVEPMDERRFRWTARGPGGSTVEWIAEVVEERPNQRIAWRSVEGSEFENSGSVQFIPAPGQRGTIVMVELSYRPPAGALGAVIAKLMGREPGQQIEEDLRRLKQTMEAGEIITTAGQPAGRATGTSSKFDWTSRRDEALNSVHYGEAS